jgi:benzodiazapine receptor
MSFVKVHFPKLVASIVLAQGAGIIGSLFTADAVRTWYVALDKPLFSPPNWVFAPVWTILYTFMGLALYLVWTRHVGGMRRVWWMRLFLVHLVLNAAWSILFFGQQMLAGALVDIAILWLFIVVLIGLAATFEKRAAALLVPYLLWVSFAAALNYELWRLNG